MKFFLDSANIDAIRRFWDIGVIDGVTTNPSLLAKEGNDPKKQIGSIVGMVKGSVSVEVTATDYEGMLRQGRSIAKLGSNVAVKLPMTVDGIHATKTLSGEGIGVNVTLVFSANQALLAAKAGAAFVSPFIGRIDDTGQDGIAALEEIVRIFRNYDFKAKVLAGSIRHPMHVMKAALAGADICTMPADVLEKLFAHPLTGIGLEKFSKDWEALKGKIGFTDPF